MTDYEKEVIITLNAGQDMAVVYSANPEWTEKMDGPCMEIPNFSALSGGRKPASCM